MAYDPWLDAAQRHPGLHIERYPIRPARGAFVAGEGVILLDVGLLRPERNCTLAHELAHVDLAHAPTGRRWFDRRQEAQADDLACDRLVALTDLARALRWALCAEEVAAELDVTPAVVRRRLRRLTDQDKAWVAEQLQEAAC